MNILAFLIPVSLCLGGVGLLAFLWSLRADQYDDLDGAAWRILMDDATATNSPEEHPEVPNQQS